MSIVDVKHVEKIDPMFKRSDLKLESLQRLNNKKSENIKDIIDNKGNDKISSPTIYSKQMSASLSTIEEIKYLEHVDGGIKLNGYFVKDTEIIQQFKAIRSYTAIPSRNNVPDLSLVSGITKSEVFVKNNGKTEKIIQYEFDQESRDHRTAIATFIKFNKEHGKKISYIIKPHNNSSLRVTNPRANDVLLSPIKDNTKGEGTKENPYQFTKGLNYSEIKDKIINSPHVKSLNRNINLAERARSDNGALLLQITPDKTKSIAAYNTKNNGVSGPKAMQAVERSNRFDHIIAPQCKDSLSEVILAHKKYGTQIEDVSCERKACNFIASVLIERRQTPPPRLVLDV